MIRKNWPRENSSLEERSQEGRNGPSWAGYNHDTYGRNERDSSERKEGDESTCPTKQQYTAEVI